MKAINCVGIVGLGNISLRHRRNIRALFPGVTIYLVSSSGRELPDDLLLDGEAMLASIEELVTQEPNFVVVCSPATFHNAHAVPLLQAGIPTLIEKPVAATVEECEAIIAAAKEGGAKAAVGYCLRFMPALDVVRDVLARGSLGEIVTVSSHCGQYLPDWRPAVDFRSTASARKELGGGALLELSHELDYLDLIFGNLSPRFAWLRHSLNLKLEVEDMVDLVLEGEHGVPVYVHLNFIEKPPARSFKIIAEKGSLSWDLLENVVSIRSRDDEKTIFSDPGWDKNQMYLGMIGAFAAGDFNRLATLDSARRTVQLIEQLKNIACPFLLE